MIKAAAHSLTLEGDIGIYFYIDVRGAKNSIVPQSEITFQNIIDGDYSIDFSFSWKTTPAPYTDLSASNFTLNSSNAAGVYDSQKGLFKIKCNTAVAEMSCLVHANAIVKDSTGAVVYTDSEDYSVRDYAMTIINNTKGEFSPELVNLSKAMLDFGTKAQTVFGIATNSPANAGVDYSMADVSAETIETAISAANGEQSQSDMKEGTADFYSEYKGSTIMFLTKTTLRHYYIASDQELFNTKRSSAVGFTFNDSKAPYMMFEKSNIPAKELDTLQEFTIDGKTYNYSVLDYSKNVLRNPNADQANKNLAKATYWYNYYANLYFTN